MELCKSDIYFIILLIFNLFLFYKFYELKNITKENVKELFDVENDNLNVKGVITAGAINAGAITAYGLDFKRLSSLFTCAGFAINADGSTFLLHEGEYQLRGSGIYGDIFADDRWDAIYIYKGWRVQCFDGLYFDGALLINHHNRDSIIPYRIKSISDKISSYRATWAGY